MIRSYHTLNEFCLRICYQISFATDPLIYFAGRQKEDMYPKRRQKLSPSLCFELYKIENGKRLIKSATDDKYNETINMQQQ